jgi:hypothetical protein
VAELLTTIGFIVFFWMLGRGLRCASARRVAPRAVLCDLLTRS